MGLKFSLKKAILSRSMEKRKKQMPFDVDYSDNFVIPPDAGDFFNNSHYYSLHSKDSLQSLYVRFALRGGKADNEVWFWFSDREGNVWYAEKDHYAKDEQVPFSVAVIEPGKKLSFSYQGKVRRAAVDLAGDHTADPASPLVDAVLNGIFYGKKNCFEFSRHMSTEPVARAFAAEKWTKAFLSDLKENHQVHYEQEGTLDAVLKIDGKSYQFKDERVFRDHSYGKRDWEYFDRYIWIYGQLDNGDTVQCSMVRYPIVKELQTGFYIKGDKVACLKSVTSMDAVETNGSCPNALDIMLEFDDGTTVRLRTQRQFNTRYLFSKGGFVINEGVSEFDANGVKGRGITEFGFNADQTRWRR